MTRLARGFQWMAVCLLLALPLQAADPWVPAITQQALDSGFLQRLPVAVSKAFGLPKADDGTDVRQLLKKDGRRIRTFNVGVANHSDLVIFSIDAKEGANVAYLISADGSLRKAVSYQTGSNDTSELSAADARTGLARETRFWSAQAKKKPAKQ